MILCDWQIAEKCNSKVTQKPMITPFVEKTIRQLNGEKVLSYGLSSYGYDIRMGEDLFIIEGVQDDDYTLPIDPKSFKDTARLVKSTNYIIPGNSGALTHSIETFNMPKDISAICLGKSTYARCGLIVNVTPLEAGWEGVLTIELINTNPAPIKVYPLEGIAQLLYLQGDNCNLPYELRSGKYQNQTGVTTAEV